MKILAIETSCDDTCVAILEIRNFKLEILSNIVSSQVNLHAKYGGVYPFMAKREHQRNLPIVFKKALKKAKNPKINLIAVTIGPGLEPCLWVGVNFAKDLSQSLNLPLVPVNHIEAHILANWLVPIGSKSKITPSPKFGGEQNSKLFPAICLVVSGGHTQLILMRGFGNYKILGETRDDAAGECFDKVARILGLGYPGGPIVAKMATKFKMQNIKCKIKLPRPMIYQKNYDFSFSGLKTAVLYLVKNLTLGTRAKRRVEKNECSLTNNKLLTIEQKRETCAEVQQSIIDVLIHKTIKAAKEYKVKTIILGGGVAANEELRKQFKKACLNLKFKHLVPPKNLCTDNAAMIAVAGYFHTRAKRRVEKVAETSFFSRLASGSTNECSSTRQEKRKPESVEADANQRI